MGHFIRRGKMRKFNRLLILLSAICVICSAFLFVSCGKENDSTNSGSDGGYFPIDEEKPQIILSDAVLEIEAGDERELTVSLYNAEGDISWESGDISVATVENGLVTAIKEGETTVTATCGDLTASCEVTVKKSTAAPVIKTNFEEIVMENGDTVAVSATVYRKNKLVNTNVVWSIEGDDITSFTATEKDGKFVVKANAGGKKAIIFAAAEVNGIKAFKAIEVTTVESGAIGKAEFIEETIKALPNEISAMTVAEVSSLAELFEGYDALTATEKGKISEESAVKLAAIRNSFTSADWKYLLNEKTTLNSVKSDETAGEKPAYATENKIAQGEKFGLAFDYSRFKEVYFALKISEGNGIPSLCNDSGAFVIEQDKWYYFKNISCSDGCVLMVSDEIDGEYSIVKIERYPDKDSAPKNLSDLLILNNVSSMETLSWNATATGLYTNSVLDAVKVYAGELPSKEDSSADNWDEIYKAYQMLGLLTSEEKAQVPSEADKIETLYAEWTDFFDKEISTWGSMDVKNMFEISETASVEFGSAGVYKRGGVKADDDMIGKAGIYLDYGGLKGEYHFAVKATEAVRFKESRNYLLEANQWYIVRILKNPEAAYGGWNIYVKPAGDTDYVKLDYAFEWRLGNHAQYNGKAYLNCFFVFTSEYGTSFDVYSTSMYAVDPPTEYPFTGMDKVAESVLIDSALLQAEKYLGENVYKLSDLTTNTTAVVYNNIGGDYAMDSKGAYSEYYFAIKVTEGARICTGSGEAILKEYNWYIVKFTKNADAQYGGWNLFIKLAYEPDDKYMQVAVGDQWRLGNHSSYNGIAYLYTAIAIYTTNGWDVPFDVYVTGLFGVRETVIDPFTDKTKVAESSLNSSAALQEEKFCDKSVYKLSGITTNGTANANSVGCEYVMDYNDGTYSEYYLAIKATADLRICTGSGDVILKKGNWYVVKFTKNEQADYGGWNLSVKSAYAGDDTYAQVAVGDQWRLGNHSAYNGKAYLNCVLSLYTTDGWDISFDVYATGLYAK